MAFPFTSYNDVRPEVASFESYEPGLSIAEIAERYGLSQVIKMASNENPLGVSPYVRQIIADTAKNSFRYPQSGNPRLVKAIAEYYHVDKKRIFIGNGSDEVIDLLFRVRAVPGVHNAVAFRPCFGLYPTQAKMAGVELRQVPLKEDFSFDFSALLSQVDNNTTLVLVTSPDNPSGRIADLGELEALSKALPPACLLVIDEAYIEFAGEDHSLLTRLDHLPNVTLMRTFSKVYGLAGLRIGYAILPEAVADYLWRVRLPFSLNIIAEEAALAALADAEFRQKTIDLVHRGRSLLTQELRAMGCEVLPSFSNFIMFRTPEGSVSVKTLHGELLRRGIIIRALGGYHLPDWLRVSVGTDEENALFLQYTREILGLGSSQSPMIITIDGPAGVGKSTLARRLAAELSIAYLDTGAMYRILGLRLGAEAADLSDDQLRMRCREYHFTLESKENVASPVLCCNGVAVGSEIRTEKAGRLASLVARLPVLREELQRAQREIGMYCSLVAEGRDMGTHVFPNASCKFFLDARPQIRAERRYRELEAVGALNGATLDDICSAMESRDAQDRNRDIDPLRPAEQAVIVDTSDLDLESVFKVLLTSVQNVCTA